MSTNDTINMMAEAQIQEPKSTQGLFTLPCGYLDAAGVLHTEVLLREINGRDEDMLASKKTPDKKKINQLLISCIQRLGSITDRDEIAKAVPRMLIGDRIFLVVAVRRTSLGDDYPYKDKCPSCDKESLMRIDLSELEVVPMPEPMRRVFDVRMPSRAACRAWADTGSLPAIEKTTPTGNLVRFHPITGLDEETFGSVKDKEDAISKSLLARVDMLNERPPSVDELQNLTLAERQYLRDVVFDSADGGVETTLDVTCPACENEYSRELDITQMGFFFPSAARKTSKAKSST